MVPEGPGPVGPGEGPEENEPPALFKVGGEVHVGVLPQVPYGVFMTGQREAIRGVVRGREVHDLGAGDLMLSHELLRMGASKVVAIDKEAPRSLKGDSRIQVIEGYFHAYKGDIDVAFMSWPQNYNDEGILRLIERAGTVVYLGKNTDGSACGSLRMFEHLVGRELLAHVPDRANTLIVYGKPLEEPREPVGEEMAALTVNHHMWTFEEVANPARVPMKKP